jgi:glycosyltransferase involved in cell wall biosynthesis
VKPKISIVIPTHNRSGILVQTLNSLAVQTVPADVYDVTVVADGCRDDTAARVRSLTLPYAVRLIEQSPRGAAAARNRGAAEVSSPLILFLDDDMEAMPRLVAAHLEVHAQVWRGVVMGYFSAPRASQPDDIFLKSIDLWWNDHFSEMSSPGHRYTFRDVCTGNLSLPKELFQAAGCFDEAFIDKAGEDYDWASGCQNEAVQFACRPCRAPLLPTIARVGGAHSTRAEVCYGAQDRNVSGAAVDPGWKTGLMFGSSGSGFVLDDGGSATAIGVARARDRSLRFRRRWQRLMVSRHRAYWRCPVQVGSHAEMTRF